MTSRDWVVPTGRRPIPLENAVPRGYVMISFKRFREFYSIGDEWYSWVFTKGDEKDTGSIYGPLQVV